MVSKKDNNDVDIRNPWDRLTEPFFIGFFILVVIACAVGLAIGVWMTPWGRLVEACMACAGIAIVIVIAGLMLTWFEYWLVRSKRWAQRPAILFAAGEEEKAEEAFREALQQADRFAAGDRRRAVMYYTLAHYAANQGRRDEAEDLFQKSIEILGKIRGKEPGAYFTLNEYAHFLTTGKRYEHAQSILETALDMATPIAHKVVGGAAAQFEKIDFLTIDFLTHDNLASLLLAIKEPDLASWYLQYMEAALASMWKNERDKYQGRALVTKCLLLLQGGQHVEARSLIEKAEGVASPLLDYVQTKVALAFQEWEAADEHSGKHLAQARKSGPLHRPELLDSILDAAECKLALDDQEEAMNLLAEARSIVVDFALPTDAQWVKSLETWLQRAKDLGRNEVAQSLAAELAQAAAKPCQAITILEKFRVHKQGADEQ